MVKSPNGSPALSCKATVSPILITGMAMLVAEIYVTFKTFAPLGIINER
jgi:hypothetical protein